MNKNPERGKYMDEIMSKVFNPLYKTDLEKYKAKQKNILKEIFEE